MRLVEHDDPVRSRNTRHHRRCVVADAVDICATVDCDCVEPTGEGMDDGRRVDVQREGELKVGRHVRR